MTADVSWMTLSIQLAQLQASKRAILNANYMAARLASHYPVLFK